MFKQELGNSIQGSIRSVQIISSPGVGGRELHVPIVARKLLEQGHATWVVCKPQTLVEKVSREWNLPLHPTWMHGYFDPAAIWKLAVFLKKQQIQIIHAHWSRDLSNLILASALAGHIPIVLTKHVYATERKIDPFHNWVYRHTDRVIAVSDLVRRNVLETVKISAERVITIYNGIELNNLWHPKQVSGADIRQELGVPSRNPFLVYAGRINPGKGPHLIVEAFGKIMHEFKEWHLVIVGKAVGESEEKYERELRATIQHNHMDKRVHFSGFRTDMPEVIQTASVLVNASAFESLGMVVVEAMAMEKPVIGPDCGGIPEIIEPGVCGELFRYGDVENLAVKIRDLISNPGLMRTMGRAGRKIVERKFNLDGMTREYVSLYRTLLKH